MRTFDYMNLPKPLFERAVGDLNALLHQDKGKMGMLERLHPAELASLEARAHLDNVAASLAIEGMSVPERRLAELVDAEAHAWPQLDVKLVAELDEVESQAYGFSHALRSIERDAGALELSPARAVGFFEDVFCKRSFGRRSRYRQKDYVYTQVDGHMQAVSVSPVVAFETPLVFGSACDSLADAFDARHCSPLILAAVFMVDMLCIRPFDEGNGRIMRLMSMLLLQKAGFGIFRYQSVDKLVEQDAAAYYDALNACVEGWDQGRNDYRPFAKYWFEKLHEAYQGLFDHMELRARAPRGKGARVRAFVEAAAFPVGKRAIMAANPDISLSTVEAVLGELVKEGMVRKVGKGRATAYEWVR